MSTEAGWLEATIAWAVCASLHREFAKGRDPLYKTRQKDFTKHEEDARAKYLYWKGVSVLAKKRKAAAKKKAAKKSKKK